MYDDGAGELSFPYFVDEIDPLPEPRPPGKGMTEYVLRHGEPLLASPAVAVDLERAGEVELIGAPSLDWLGVPLQAQGTTFGVLVVQSYTEGVRYGAEEKAILMFVSRQVAMAIARTRAQEALRASEQRLRDIVEHSTNLFYSHTPDQVLTYASPQSRHFFDCEPEELLVRWTTLATDNPVNREGLERTVRAIETGQPQPPYELELVGKAGRKVWVEVREAPVVRDGRTIAIVGSLTDISERKHVEDALRESEERYRRLVELSPDGIAIHQNGLLVFCNETGARLLGYTSAADAIGRPVLGFVHPSSRDLVRERIRTALARGEAQPPVQEKFVRADGSPIDVEVASIPFLLDGRPAMQVVIRDISPRLRLEEHVRHMQKMEAIGRLAGGVAHDFNNLLQALLSTVEVVRVRGSNPESLGGTVSELEAHVRRGAALTRQLLLFARRELVKPERLDLNEVVAEAAKLLRRLVRENIRLALAPAPGSLPLVADRGQLEQVLVNLVVNGSDAMPEGGDLVIRTGRLGEGEVWLEVGDTGVGIPDEVRERIFEPFFTTKASEHGTGLGLAVVHGIVTQHNGRLEVTSAVGSGSTFRVILPGAPLGPDEPPPARSGDDDATSGHGEAVLVVEDEDGARKALREILEILGFEVTVAASGEEAEEAAAGSAFDVLLTDLILPGIDGGELARRLARARPQMKVIVMSGYSEDETMRRGIRSGEVRFLQKPFDGHTLARAMRAALENEPG